MRSEFGSGQTHQTGRCRGRPYPYNPNPRGLKFDAFALCAKIPGLSILYQSEYNMGYKGLTRGYCLVDALEVIVMSGPYDGQSIRVESPNNRNVDHGIGYIIGRHQSCDVSFPYDRWISSRHARLYFQDDMWFIEDLRSTNHTFLANTRADGTFAGKQRLTGSREVAYGQLIQLGRIWVRIQKG